ncbi:filamentous hemagglutinin N-terminal domain-containing protein [Nostoc sp. CCY0012]|uniref:two-partner secretion domain-containing protein n=1 Tax=Nostoc sp. CCY0012 TaxID=1056123 RepID=UPI0039C670BA
MYFLLISPVEAQVVPDKTLPTNSIITTEENISRIEGGSKGGGNLFHSFENFSVPTGTTVYFNNASDIQNIISRVTGKSISNIDGIIRANGKANLFLLNPNGIVFGKNARLDVGGSFIGTTASSLKLSDGGEFSALNPQAPPLLKIATPIGLQFGSNSGAIQVQGTSQGLIAPSSINSPTVRNSVATGLSVTAGKTLALVGNNITLNGATLAADGGRIELGSVSNGVVILSPFPQGWSLDYKGVSSFGDINLSNQSLIDASGERGGDITIKGKNVSLFSGSALLIQNQDSPDLGNINIEALDSLTLEGISPNGRFPSILRTESLGTGSGGNINITASKLTLERRGGISNRNYGNGLGGNINISASDSVNVLGGINPSGVSNILTTALASGKAGDITVSTRRLEARDGGGISSNSVRKGDGGNITINALDSVEVSNSEQLINSGEFLVPSAISTLAFTEGNAGNLVINTRKMMVGELSSVNTSSVGSGSAGSVTINVPDLKLSGDISSAVVVAEPQTQAFFGSPAIPSGNPGAVTINTNYFRLLSGTVSVRNLGTGNGGTAIINGRSISLKNEATITATTTSLDGGNIILNAKNINLINNSKITTTAENNGNGGNININTNILTASKNSSITANAFEGRGGNININTKGLFLSPDSQITASSETGINGTVEINFTDKDPSRVQAAPQTVMQTPKVVSACGSNSSAVASFINTGAGGIPRSPSDMLSSKSGWHDNSMPTKSINNLNNLNSSTIQEPQIVEAQGLITDYNGTIFLTEKPNNVAISDHLLTALSCQ